MSFGTVSDVRTLHHFTAKGSCCNGILNADLLASPLAEAFRQALCRLPLVDTICPRELS